MNKHLDPNSEKYYSIEGLKSRIQLTEYSIKVSNSAQAKAEMEKELLLMKNQLRSLKIKNEMYSKFDGVNLKNQLKTLKLILRRLSSHQNKPEYFEIRSKINMIKAELLNRKRTKGAI